MRVIFVLAIIAFLLPAVTFALDECKGTVDINEVPCLILLPVNITTTPCNTITVEMLNESQSLYNQTMSQYSPFKCQGEFNLTSPSTYNFGYSTGDTGSIIVDAGRIMELLLYFGAAISLAVIIIGFYLKDQFILSFGSMLLIVEGIFIGLNGFSILNNLVTNGIAAIIVGMGAYIFLRTNMEDFISILNG